ncbi:MAG: sodium/solute symporter [Pirellulales bacterium]|nr:sodium/solute symporter [Pirellulales bacterium]
MHINLHWIDLTILAAYLATMAGIGIYFSKRQRKLEDFFLARRGMSWLPVGLSLMAALNSGIDYVMQPAAVIKFGIILLIGNLSWFLLYPYVFFVTLPMFRRLNVYSAYEYLERRFNLAVRGLGAAIFILWRIGWMATALYVPCLAISTAVGRDDLLMPMIVTLGGLVTFYTMLGGIRAVIWTDVTQFCIMFSGLAGTLLIAWWNVPGGFTEIFQCATEVGASSTAGLVADTENVWKPLGEFFATPVTVVGILVAVVVARLGTYTSDQVMVQRFQTTRSIRDARQGFFITAVSDTIWMTALAIVGLALFAYFQHHAIPPVVQDNPDNIFPYFLGEVFPIGLTGLVIAAILAASLSSIDSALNSLTSVLTVDFYNRICLNRSRPDDTSDEREQRRQIRVSRSITLCLGMIGTALSCNVHRLGTIFEIANKLINSFTGPLLGVFLLGMFTRRANGPGVFLGGFVGTGVTLFVVHLSNIGQVSFLWPSTFGLLTTLVVGYVVSIVMQSFSPARPQWTFSEILSRIDLEEER